MKKTLFVILAIVICAALVISCSSQGKTDAASSDWAGIEEKGNMVIGYTVYDPMNYFDSEGNFIGFDTEYAEAVCEFC